MRFIIKINNKKNFDIIFEIMTDDYDNLLTSYGAWKHIEITSKLYRFTIISIKTSLYRNTVSQINYLCFADSACHKY